MNKTEKLDVYFQTLARESFKSEKLIYDKIKSNPYTSVEVLYDKLIKSSGFPQYQDDIQTAIYGDNVEWIKYLYDKAVIKKIVSTGSSKISELYKIRGFDAKNYLSVGKLRGKRGNILKRNLDTQFKKIGQDMSKNFSDALSQKGDISDSPAFKPMIAEIGAAITNGLKNNSFRVKVSDIDKKGNQITKIENRHIYEISETEEGGSPIFTIKGDVREILLTQNELIGIIQNSTKDIIKKYKKSLGVSYTTAESTFTEMLKFIPDSGFLKLNEKNASKDDLLMAQEFVRANALEIVRVFFQEIIYAVNSVHSGTSINKIWDYEETLVQMIQDDTHLASEIYKVNTEATASGTIGEIMFASLLGLMKTKEESVKILGQELTTTGSAAVDIKLEKQLGNEIQRVGFQIKNYSSVSDEIVLYSQANKFYDESSMIRYVESGLLKHLYNVANQIFVERSMPVNSNTAEGGDHFDEMRNILTRCVPNYIRYDQADLTTDEFGKNNFYIINFNFVPASVLFYTLAKAIETQENYLKQQNMFFFQGMHGAKSKHGLLEGYPDDLSQSWDKSWRTIRDGYLKQGKLDLTPYTGEQGSDVPNIWKENLYLNFKGVQIKFKNELNFLWSNAKKR